jgi:hypothetical protein
VKRAAILTRCVYRGHASRFHRHQVCFTSRPFNYLLGYIFYHRSFCFRVSSKFLELACNRNLLHFGGLALAYRSREGGFFF